MDSLTALAVGSAAGMVDGMLIVVLVFGGVLAAGLAVAALVAYTRRRSIPYLLVGLVFVALLARIFVGGGTTVSIIPPDAHHLVEHTLDAVMALLIVGAVYTARSIGPETYRPPNP